jgi:Fe-S cluster assembly scaffold protein SufB
MSAPDATARLTIHRTAAWDEQSRQILCDVDGVRVGQLLFGQTLTREIPAGTHAFKANNTLVWKTVPFEARPGEHVQFTVWNEPMGGWFMRLLFIFVGAAALRLGVTPGPPGPARPA